MSERRSTRKSKAANANAKKRKTKINDDFLEENEENLEDVENFEDEEEIEEEEEEVEEEEERVQKRTKKGVKQATLPAKKTPPKRKAPTIKEDPKPKKARKTPTSYIDDDEELEEIQVQFKEEHCIRFVSWFSHLLNDKTYADVVVRVKHENQVENNATGKIYAHKMILALHSKLFKSMIDSSKETLDGCTVITIDDDDITYDVAYALLEFMYKGSPNIPSLANDVKNILPVEKAIEKYLEPAFLEAFQAYMMSPDNVVCYYESAEYHKDRQQSTMALKIIHECAPALSFRNASLATIKSFIADDKFDIEEAPLFEKAVDWAHGIIEKEQGKSIKPIVHHEKDLQENQEEEDPLDSEIFTDQNIIAARAKLLSPLMDLFRFGRVSAEDFYSKVDRYNVLSEDDLLDLYPLVTEAYTPRANDPRCKQRGELDNGSTWLRSKHVKQIKKFLPNPKAKWKEVFHAKVDTLQNFWNKSRVSPLLAIFRTTTGRIFGFYTSYKWGNRNKRVAKSDLFMFTLGTGARRSEAKKLEGNTYQGIPFYEYRPHQGSINIGDGYELAVQLANGYATSQLHYAGTHPDKFALGGTYQFTVEDILCYVVK